MTARRDRCARRLREAAARMDGLVPGTPDLLRDAADLLEGGAAAAVVTSDGDTDGATGYCRCGACGQAIDPWDRWCRHCGTGVER